MIVPTLRRLALAAFLVAAANFTILTVLGGYDFRFGRLHFFASYLFKPLLYLNAAFLLALIGNTRVDAPASVPEGGQSFRSGVGFWLLAAGMVTAVYAISFTINLNFFDWTHRLLTSGVPPWHFFTRRQYDGFYRPLGFCSLWLDNLIFGPALWGYHVQNLLLHTLNGWLAARLAFRLGLNPQLSRWTGIAFLALPYSFEAVIWPGARFDLLAALFTLLALERALAGFLWVSTVAYCLAVLSKETAYAYPLLLGGLFVLRHGLGLRLTSRQWRDAFVLTLIATAVQLSVRIMIYGNLGGYPDTQHHGAPAVNFVLQTKTFTAIATRLPAVLFLFNTGAGLPIWLRIVLLGYVAFLAILVWRRAEAGRLTALLALAVIAVLPMLNMFGWITQFAQQGRYLYHPAIWVLIPLLAALGRLPCRHWLFPAWIVIMCVAALFSELVYVRMLRAIHVTEAAIATACAHSSTGCRIALDQVPRDWHGAFYYKAQLEHDLAEWGRLQSPDKTSVHSLRPLVIRIRPDGRLEVAGLTVPFESSIYNQP